MLAFTPKFQIQIPLDYTYIGGLTRVTNRYQLSEIPQEDVEVEMFMYLNLPMDFVVADERLRKVFDNTSSIYADARICEALGISSDYSAITKFAKENVPLFVWVYEGERNFPRVSIYARSPGEMFETLRNLT